MLNEARPRFFGGTLPDFDRPSTLAYSLLIAHAIAFLGLFYLLGQSYDEALSYLPAIELCILMDTAILATASHITRHYTRRRRFLRYALHLSLPFVNVIHISLLQKLSPFLPLPSVTHILAYSVLLLWSIFLMAECQHARLAPSLAEARLQALQNRIHPHFLFNSLNSVLALIRLHPQQAESLLEDMCELFRAILQDHHTTVLLEQELEWCKRYLNIEQTRLGDRMTVKWECPHRLPPIKVPPLLIQPLIENAVYHGIHSTAGTLHIHVSQKDHSLCICITNPLPSEHQGHSGHHMALDNIQQRLALCFGGEAALHTQRSAHEYTTRLVLPC